MKPDHLQLQQQIISFLNIPNCFNVEQEINQRVAFLSDYLLNSNIKNYVIGISGGVDSLAAGLLAKAAVKQLREQESFEANLIALRMPYGIQSDAQDAEDCIHLINPSNEYIINIKEATDLSMQQLISNKIEFDSDGHADFNLGNIKARQRMISLYAVAGAYRGLVVGTDQAAEMLVGFSTKYGDSAADLMPLAGLNKRMVRAIASSLGAPDALVYKVPTADLESLNPMQSDEDSLGVTYDEIDDFLEGKKISASSADVILRHWHNSEHKRTMPVPI